jgi:hypothetical protein
MDSLGPPPETSNFHCLPGRAGGTPSVLGLSPRLFAAYGSRQYVRGKPTSDADAGNRPGLRVDGDFTVHRLVGFVLPKLRH